MAAKAGAPPGEAGTQDSLWRHCDFMLLWVGQTVSEMGSSVTQLALPLTAVVLLNASTFEVALLTSAATAAFALIALPAGVIVDRHAKRGIMLACDAARVLIIGWVPLAWALGVLMLWQLYVVALVAGVATVFFDVSDQSYLPVLLKPENLMDGNGKLGATQAFAQFTVRPAAAWWGRWARQRRCGWTPSRTWCRWRRCSPSGPGNSDPSQRQSTGTCGWRSPRA